MPQNGFHGLVGLAVAKGVTPRAPAAAAQPLAVGITLGAMLPDIDMYPTAVVFLLGRPDLIYVMHRTLTHSLLAILIVAGLGAVLRRRSTAGAWACWGLSLGMLTHVFLDAFFWFAPLDLFWPLSHLPPGKPVMPVIDLWSSVRPLPAVLGKPDLLVNLREACEFAAFALYLMTLRRVTRRANTPAGACAGLGRWERWAWAGFGIALVGAWVLPRGLQEVLVVGPYLLAFAPYCWRQTVRLRGAVARWSLSSK
jgi:membrane-bound metal-dependent hydrolase YbcI (DUF457 family)